MHRNTEEHLVLFMLHDLPIRGLLSQQLSSSTLQDGLHGAEARADSRRQVKVLPLHHMKQPGINHHNNSMFGHVCVFFIQEPNLVTLETG